jgi:phosphomannomutase
MLRLKHGGEYFPSAVGEVNVVTKMKAVMLLLAVKAMVVLFCLNCIMDRDALVGIAIFLTYLAQKGKSALQLRKTFPDYFYAAKTK